MLDLFLAQMAANLLRNTIMSFFQQFPKINYDLILDGSLTSVVDIFRNVDVNDVLTDSTNAYQWLNIVDGDRPDIVSYKLYGDVRYYWTFFILNDSLKGGLQDWPKSHAELERFLEDQYDAYSVIEFSNINEAAATLNGLDMTSADIYLTNTAALRHEVETKDDPNPANRFVAPRWKVFKYDPSRFQLWITKPEYLTSGISGFNYGVNNGFSLTSTDTTWLATYSNWLHDNNLAQWQSIVSSSGGSSTSDLFYTNLQITVTFLPGISASGNRYAWYVGREAPIDYVDQYGASKTTLDIRTGNIVGNAIVTTYADHEITENDDKARVRVLTPAVVRQFAEAFEEMINV